MKHVKLIVAVASVILMVIVVGMACVVVRVQYLNDPERLQREHEHEVLSLFENGSIIARYKVVICGTEKCVSVVMDERQVMEGVVVIDDDILEMNYSVWKKYSVHKIEGRALARVILRKPFALHLERCKHGE